MGSPHPDKYGRSLVWRVVDSLFRTPISVVVKTLRSMW